VIALRHAEFVTRQLESKREMLSALPTAERAAAYSSQLSNLRAALEWSFGPEGDDETATRLAVASTPLFMELSLLTEWQCWTERALVRLPNHHRGSCREVELCASLPLALMYSEDGNLHVRAAFSRALDMAVEQGNLAYELKLLSGLFGYSFWTIDIGEALEIAARTKKVALRTRDRDDLALAEAMLGTAQHLTGDHRVAQGHFEDGLRHTAIGSRFRAGQDLFPYTSFSVVGLARSLLYRGQLDQALEYAKLAIERAERSGRPAALCRTLIMVLPVFLALEDAERVDAFAARVTEVSAAYSLLPYRAAAIGLRGQWLLLQDNPEEAARLLSKASEELRAQRQEILRMELICDLAAGLVAVDQHEEALKLVIDAIDAEQREKRFLHMPALLRAKGVILASRSHEGHAEAEKSLLSSIDWAQRQSAALFELRSATDLAGLLLVQGRISEAYKHVSAALSRTPVDVVSPCHERARHILSRFQSSSKAAG